MHILTAFSSRSASPIRPEFPATFEADAAALPIRRPSFCRLAPQRQCHLWIRQQRPKTKRPGLIESRDAPSISPPPKTALNHLMFWSGLEQRPVVTPNLFPKVADAFKLHNYIKRVPTSEIVAPFSEPKQILSPTGRTSNSIRLYRTLGFLGVLKH
jgi:hypothetical protein